MIKLVADASAVAEYLLGTPLGERIAADWTAAAADLHAPQLLLSEVLSVIRRFERTDLISAHRASAAVNHLGAMPITFWPADKLLPRIWDLRHNVSAYDATYVALAEAIGAAISTCDARLARAVDRLGTVAVRPAT